MRRQFCSYIAAVGFLIVLSIVALVSIGEAFSFLGRKEWLPSASGLAKRQSTITFTIPWDGGKISGVHEDPIDNGPYDFLPSTTTSGPSPTSSIGTTHVSIPNPGSINMKDVDHTETDTTTASPCLTCGLKEMETGLPEMLGYVSPSTSIIPSTSEPAMTSLSSASHNFTADMLNFATPMGYVCRPQLVTTQAALGCSVCTTVTETWHSTITVSVSSLLISASPVSAFANSTSENSTIDDPPCPLESGSPPVQDPPLQTISPSSFSFLNSTPTSTLPNLFPNLRTSSPTAGATTSTHPCPNAGYSCSECPGGWFCPPVQTPAMSCPCGYGWACANCVGGWYCVPGPTSTSVSVAMSAVPTPSNPISDQVSPSTTVETSSSTLGQLVDWPAFTPTISILGGVLPPLVVSVSTGSSIDSIAVSVASPIVGDVSSVVEHITATTAFSAVASSNTLMGALVTTAPPIPSVTSDTISIITTSLSVVPLILPQVSNSGFRRMKHRSLQQERNRVPPETYTSRRRGR